MKKVILLALVTGVIGLAAPADAKWRYYKIEDEMTGKRTHGIDVDGVKTSWRHEVPKAVLVCGEGENVQFALQPGPFLGGVGLHDTAAGMVRIDSNPAWSMQGYVPDGRHHIAFMSGLNGEMIRQMRKGLRLRIRVEDYERIDHDAVLTLRGFTAASNQLSRFCKLPKGWNGATPKREAQAPKPAWTREGWAYSTQMREGTLYHQIYNLEPKSPGSEGPERMIFGCKAGKKLYMEVAAGNKEISPKINRTRIIAYPQGGSHALKAEVKEQPFAHSQKVSGKLLRALGQAGMKQATIQLWQPGISVSRDNAVFKLDGFGDAVTKLSEHCRMPRGWRPK